MGGGARASRRRPAAAGWWFEDAIAGAVMEHPHGRTIGADEQLWLAWITDNASDVHGDVEYARRTPFGVPLVLGALTVAIVDGLAQPAEWPPGMAARHARTGWRAISLVGAVVPGDTLHARSEIVATIPFDDASGGVVQRVLVGVDQRGREVVRIDDRIPVPSTEQWAKDC